MYCFERNDTTSALAVGRRRPDGPTCLPGASRPFKIARCSTDMLETSSRQRRQAIKVNKPPGCRVASALSERACWRCHQTRTAGTVVPHAHDPGETAVG